MQDYDDEPEPYPNITTGYPAIVRAAGIVWIIFGGLILVNLVLFLLLMSGVAAAGQAGAAAVGGTCGAVVMGLFGAAFIFVGVQSVNGTAPDTLGNGIGSIIFGLLNIGSGALQVGVGNIIGALIALFAGGGLIAAGVMALVGRDQYKAWRRRAQSPGGPGPRR